MLHDQSEREREREALAHLPTKALSQYSRYARRALGDTTGGGGELMSAAKVTVADEDRVEEPRAKKLRGFAAMTPEQRAELGRRGGKSAHERGTANRFTSDSASAAGRVAHERGTAYRWSSEEARDAGRKSWDVQHSRRTR